MDEDGRRLPYKGCELRRHTVVRRLGQPPAGWKLPTFAAGFMRRKPHPHTDPKPCTPAGWRLPTFAAGFVCRKPHPHTCTGP